MFPKYFVWETEGMPILGADWGLQGLRGKKSYYGQHWWCSAGSLERTVVSWAWKRSLPFGCSVILSGMWGWAWGSSGSPFLGCRGVCSVLCPGPYACLWCHFSVSRTAVLRPLLGHLAWDCSENLQWQSLRVMCSSLVCLFSDCTPSLAAPRHCQGGRVLDAPWGSAGSAGWASRALRGL